MAELETIEKMHGNLSEIFDKVLTLHKMQSDEQRYEKEPVDLEADVLSHAVDYARGASRQTESAERSRRASTRRCARSAAARAACSRAVSTSSRCSRTA